MKKLLSLLSVLISTSIFAGTALGQDLSTSFTLGSTTRGNYIPVITQGGVPTSGIVFEDYVFDCRLVGACQGELQEHIGFSMPNNPAVPGNRFAGSCTGVVITNTIPAYGTKTQQPPGMLQSQEICTVNGPGYAETWTGTLTYNYVSVQQKHCSSGHPVCVTAWYPVFTGGSGTLSITF